jgi:hypothetical protein
VQKSNYCRVIVYGKANKNKLGVQAKVKRISEKLADLKPRPEKPKAKIRTGAEGAGHRA